MAKNHKSFGRKIYSKGRRGQREANQLLKNLDYIVIEANSGKSSEDFIAIDQKSNITYSVEVKNHATINITAFLKQTKEQAERRKLKNWLLLIRLGKGYGWLILKNDKMAFIANL